MEPTGLLDGGRLAAPTPFSGGLTLAADAEDGDGRVGAVAGAAGRRAAGALAAGAVLEGLVTGAADGSRVGAALRAGPLPAAGCERAFALKAELAAVPAGGRGA